jgi:hypothetical protein
VKFWEVAALRNHKMKKLILSAALAATVVGAGLSTRANATPATLGFYPATDIYGPGTFHLDVDTYGKGVNADAIVSSGLTYGIGDKDGAFGRSEVGLDYVLSLAGAAPSTLGIKAGKRLLFNAKTQLFNNSESGTRVVAGVWGVGNKAIFAPNVGYITGSKTFEFGRVHLGLAHSFAKKATVATPAGNADRTNLQLGFDRYITPKLQFAADFYSGKSGYSGFQPTLYYYINDKADFGLGYMRFNDQTVTPKRNQIYACFDYNFGGGGSTPAPETAPAAPATN